MIIPRELIAKVIPFLKRREFISIIGPRQCGKTTFLGILRDYLIDSFNVRESEIKTITFEDRRLMAQFEEEPVSFVKSFMRENPGEKMFYLMIDEFQYVENGGQKLKLVYDTIDKIKIIITGSSSLDLKAKVGKFMVGRILNFSLYPFNFREYLKCNNRRLEKIYSSQNKNVIDYLIKGNLFEMKKGKDIYAEELLREYERYCIWGGYPAVVLEDSEGKRNKLLSEIYNNYIFKEIKTLLELATDRNLYLLSQHLAVQTSNIIVYQNLSQVSKLNFRKLKNHMKILEETFICKEVKPFFKNRHKELSKNPKIFFLDTGFRNNLMDNMNELKKRADAGALVENTVFIRLNEFIGEESRVNFWRTKAGAEVDFVLHLQGNIVPVEVKYTSFTKERLSRSFISFLNSFKPKYGLILTKDFWGSLTKGSTQVFLIPICYL